jgi:HEAT repeat protein
MPEPTPLSPELPRRVSMLARALVTAGRTWTLYPPEHPAVRTSIDRLHDSVRDACAEHRFRFGVTPDSLLVEGLPAIDNQPFINDAAAWLHQRDVVQLTFEPGVAAPSLERLVGLLAQDAGTLRERGGPAAVWRASGDTAISVEQIDFSKVLEDAGPGGTARRKDDIWRSIVRALLDDGTALDPALQARLIQISGDPVAIGDLTTDLMATRCAADGSPMITSRAATVMYAYRQIAGIVDVVTPERRSELMNKFAAVTASLDPHVALQILDATRSAVPATAADVRSGIIDAFDDERAAALLARALVTDGRPSERLAAVFDTIGSDGIRKERILKLTRSKLQGSSLGHLAEFDTLWSSMESLLLSYDDRPFVSAQYGRAMDGIGARAESMANADVPPDLAALAASLDSTNVRRLSAVLLVDLLELEVNPERAAEIALDLAALGEDLLLAGDYQGVLRVVRALDGRRSTTKRPGGEGSSIALDKLVNTAAFIEAVDLLGAMDEDSAATFADVCAAAGPATIDALRRWLEAEGPSRGRDRAMTLIERFGSAGLTRLNALIGSPHWYAQLNLAEAIARIGSHEGVPLLQPLLRGTDPRVTRAAVRALARIDHPSAARCLHTVLRAAAGQQRQAVVAALVGEQDRRVVPLLVQILDESDSFGADHAVVIDTVGAVGTLGGDAAVPSLSRVIRQRKWFARRKATALKQAGIRSLQQIASPAAHAALRQAETDGDRLLTRLLREAGSA